MYTRTTHSSGVLGGRLAIMRGGMGALGSPGSGYTLNEPLKQENVSFFALLQSSHQRNLHKIHTKQISNVVKTYLELADLTGIFVIDVFAARQREAVAEVVKLVEVWYGFLQFCVEDLKWNHFSQLHQINFQIYKTQDRHKTSHWKQVRFVSEKAECRPHHVIISRGVWGQGGGFLGLGGLGGSGGGVPHDDDADVTP